MLDAIDISLDRHLRSIDDADAAAERREFLIDDETDRILDDHAELQEALGWDDSVLVRALIAFQRAHNAPEAAGLRLREALRDVVRPYAEACADRRAQEMDDY